MTKTEVPSICQVALKGISEQEYSLIWHSGIVELGRSVFITAKRSIVV